MGKERYQIDWDSRVVVLKYIRKYEQYKQWLEAEKEKIMQPSPKETDGMPRGSGVANLPLASVEALERLEQTHRAKVVRAIDGARAVMCADIEDEGVREAVCRAIWLSCQDGNRYNFDFFAGLIPYERRAFYYYKNELLVQIKNNLNL